MKTVCIVGMVVLSLGLYASAGDLASCNLDNHDDTWYDDDSVQTQALTVASGIATSYVTHSDPLQFRDGSYYNDVMGSIDWDETSLANAISAGYYYQWLTVAADGQQITVTNLAFEFGEILGAGEEFTIAIMTDKDGFSAGNEIGSATMNDTQNGLSYAVAVSGAKYSGITNLEVRLYAYSSGVDAIDLTDRFCIGEVDETDGAQDLLLQGTTEPRADLGTLILIK